MSKLEKILIPFIIDDIKPVDLTLSAGFIDSFTYDPDHPTGENEFFLVYDDTVRNKFVQERALRLESSKNLKRRYVKIVNNKPYYIYSFWVPPTCKSFYKGKVSLTTSNKLLLLHFWGEFDSLIEDIMNKSTIKVDVNHNIPLETYPEDLNGITIQKGDSLV